MNAATGASAMALGENASANGASALAMGEGASAAGANSVAIGAGAKATVANQFALGTIASTYVMPGVTSAASLAAQNGTTYFATTDVDGHLATSNYGPQDIASLYNSVSTLRSDVIRGYEGSAIALAVGGGVLPDNKKFAISTNWGGYHGTNALGASAYVRLNENFVFNGGVGLGLTKGDVGGRAGVTFTW